jgi:hypothetical protein
VVLLAVSAAVAASTAMAQKSTAPTEEQRQRAREAYGRGQQLFKADKYDEAEQAFNEAFEAVPNPVVLVSVGECQRKKGEAVKAVATFEKYLEMRPSAPDREAVEQKILELESLPATLAVDSDPQGASVRIDGQDTGKVTPAEFELLPGEHEVTLLVNGEEKVTEKVTAQFGTRHEMRVELGAEDLVDPFAAEPTAAEEAPAEEPVDERESSVVPWVVIGVGGAAIATGVVLGVLTLGERSDFEDNPTHDGADTGERLALFTDVAFGVGAVAVVTGVVLLLTEEEGGEQAASALQVAGGGGVEVMPAVSSEAAGVSARMQF